MCSLEIPAAPVAFAAPSALPEPPLRTAPLAKGSRRRRLWELDGHAHCPVLGVCVPIGALRRAVDKALGGTVAADDYELHCVAVTDAKQRTPVAEALQKELERRYALDVRRAAQAKCTQALAAWWLEAATSRNLAGALWAVLTHPRCTHELEQRVLGDVHMLQHQVGMATRVDAARLEELIDANGLLARDLATAQARSTRVAAEQARVIEQLQSTIVRLRGELASAATLLSQGREQLQALEDAAPGLRSRFELALENERLLGRMHELQRSQLRWHQEAERQRRRADEVTPPSPPPSSPQAGSGNVVGAGAALRDRSVLCVGGRPASVPFYRRVIERTGGRFLHHDGGDEDNVVQLDATLDSADLVICQTGCISHDAYWRVKDHCKRTGKPCVFVESPSRAGLERALGLVRPTASTNDA